MTAGAEEREPAGRADRPAPGGLTRRAFLLAAGGAVAGGAAFAAAGEGAAQPPPVAKVPSNPFLGTGGAAFTVGAPCLQAPGETTMGVSWAVSGLSKGVVEYADNAAFRDAKIAQSGACGLVPVDVAALQVRLTGLRPATKYWYRTITTPFTDYANIYNAKLGESVVSPVHTFTTMGAGAAAHFCVINDTHARWKPFQMAVRKVKELAPSAVVWNGDATNTTQDKKTAVQTFLDPPVDDRDWSADIPVFFENGNHDFRGSWISKKEEVVLPRDAAERRGDQWNLKWNFAVRLGDLALIGLDSGEDKPDAHPKWFGLANFEPYRKAQAKWLEEQFARPDIAAAKYKIVFCHIPLFAAEGSPAYPHDGVKIDPHDFAYWSRECAGLWGPLIERAGVQLVVGAHQHRFRFDEPSAARRWAQVVGGGPECGTSDASRFPTVVEGKIENGRLRLRVHDVFGGRVVLDWFIDA